MKDSRRFADLLNAEWYQGKSVVLPENIHEKTDGTFRIHKASDKIHTAKIAGDVVKEITVKGKPLWVILEIQSDTHFAMPVRIFNEEGMQYQEHAGQRSGIHLMKQIYRLQTSGKDRREIARICGLSERQLDDILKEES